MRVGFQGERGAYSEIAALKYFNNADLIPYKTLSDLFYSISKDVDYGVIPLENSIEGSVNEACDLLLNTDLDIIGEVYVRIIHCLISYKDSNINDIKIVYSHPQALGQCREFINNHKFEAIPYYDTAGSVKMLANNIIHGGAAIASKRAAEIYNMKVLVEGIEDNKNNYTRFLILGKGKREPTNNDKTSIIFTVKHAPGALCNILNEFAIRGINLTMIISRPIKDKPWEYNFYLDFEGHVKDPHIKECLDSIKSKTSFLKILGSYPRSDIRT